MKTHSSLNTSNKYGDADADGQPGWSMECIVCHDAHDHKQLKTYGSESYLYQGTSTAVTTTTITQTGAGWIVDQYQGLIVVPNISQNTYNYKILSNTSDTLNIQGPIDLGRVSAGDTFAIIYGKLMKSTITTPNSSDMPVKFYGETGANSFADGDAVYEGVCEVCHTQTVYHRNTAVGDHNHNAAIDCMTCHQHTEGFKAGGCDVCHGYPPTVDAATGGPDGLANNPGVTGSLTAGAHNKHVNDKFYSCEYCHNNSVGSGATHNSGLTITMGFSLFGGAFQGGAYDGQSGVNYDTTATAPLTSVTNSGSKTCSNVYCHSTGQSTLDENDATPVYSNAVWDNPSSAACGTCHKVSEATGLTSGSHPEHLVHTGVNGCGDCHTGAANDASSYNSTDHVNASIDVSNTYTAGGTPGNGYGTCSTASCHDDGTGNLIVSPEWGSDAAACTACHDAVPVTGSHSKHLAAIGVECNDCHDNVVESLTPPEQHLDNNIDVYDSVSGDLGYPENKAKGTAYSSCTTASCHNDGTGTLVETPRWGTTSPGCSVCHDIAPGTGSHSSHLSVSGIGCDDCHDVTVQGMTAPAQHLDNNIDVYDTASGDLGYPENKTMGTAYSNCTTASCHDDGTGNPAPTPVWGTAAAACTECHAAAPATGSHTPHLAVNGIKCNNCHDNAVESTTAPTQHLDDNIDVYDSVVGDLGYPQDKAKGSAYASCSNIYCHGNYNGSGLNASPTWGNAASGACGTCHGAPTAASPNDYPDSGKHRKHASGINDGAGLPLNRRFACTLCHQDIVTGAGPTDYTIGDYTKHANTKVDWKFNTADPRMAIGTPSYSIATGTEVPTDGDIPNRFFGSCSNVYCHSNVQGQADGTGPPTNYNTMEWRTTKFAGCGATNCHDAIYHGTGNPPLISSGSHTKHLGYKFNINSDLDPAWGVVCTVCHKWDASAPFDNSCSSCHSDPSGQTAVDSLHVNALVDVIFDDEFGASATYNDNTATPGEPGNGYFSCSSVYCHSTGQSTTDGNSATPTYVTPTWGNAGSGACGTCHEVSVGSVTSGSHDVHLNATGVNGCGDCHTGAANDGSSYNDTVKHVNKSIDVANTYSAGGAPGNGYGTCSTASCHSNSLGTYKTTPTWGTSGTTCNTCHNSLPTSGAHSKHVFAAASAYGSTSVNSTSGNYDFGCGNCHPVTEAGNHRNGTLDLSLNKNHAGAIKSKNGVTNDTSGYSQTPGTSVTCSAAYCHSDTKGNYQSTPDWYGGSFTGDVCANCHGNSPATGSHDAHVVGIHYDDIYSGTSGLISASGASGAGHGDAATSTTINCNICHNDTLTVSRNDNNTVCNTCHNAEGNAIASTDLDKSKHVNGTANIGFANVTIRSKAQIRDDITTVTGLNTYWQRNNSYKAGATSHDSSKATLGSTGSFSAGTCSTVACHNGNAVTWGTTISCNSCHKGLP